MADERFNLEKKERNRKDKYKSIRKNKRKWLSGGRRYDVLTDANVYNEQQQQEGTSDASSDQPNASSSLEILLPAPVFPDHDIVSIKQSKQWVDLSVTPLKERKTRKRTRESSSFCS